MAVHIHEFLYRGRADGSSETPAWHLTLMSVGQNDFGEDVRSERTLNMAQAEAVGWTLPKIIDVINSDVMREIEARCVEIVNLTAELSKVNDEIDNLRAELSNQVKAAAAGTLSESTELSVAGLQ